MRPLLPLLAAAALLTSCSSGGGGDAAPGEWGWVLVTVADVDTPNGTFDVRNVEDVTAVRLLLRKGETVLVEAQPDPGHRVAWSGCDDDTSTGTSNTFTAQGDGQTVTLEFLPTTGG